MTDEPKRHPNGTLTGSQTLDSILINGPFGRRQDEQVSDGRSAHAFPIWAKEEVCRCGRGAAHKVEETSGPDNFHPLTAYLCCGCFARTVGDCSRYPYAPVAAPGE
ncbi:MAG TPA: hypothetical protein VIQ30_26355 [Pseudonocardia sp.]